MMVHDGTSIVAIESTEWTSLDIINETTSADMTPSDQYECVLAYKYEINRNHTCIDDVSRARCVVSKQSCIAHINLIISYLITETENGTQQTPGQLSIQICPHNCMNNDIY